MAKTAAIYGINGPVISLRGNTGFEMSEMVYIGKERLVGEVIRLTKDTTTVQCFEETTGLRPGETVEAAGDAISVLLGPGILHNIFDGIQRPLSEIALRSGKYITRGVSVDALDTQKKWQTHVTVEAGQEVQGGTVIAEVPETTSITHRSMVPPNLSGTIVRTVPDGEYTIEDVIAVLEPADRAAEDTRAAAGPGQAGPAKKDPHAPASPMTAFLAHTDVVFPDTEPLPMTQEGSILKAPGIGDDTANLVHLMLGARWLSAHRAELRKGVLIAANACEAGLS